jgi:hypothetical protein
MLGLVAISEREACISGVKLINLGARLAFI